MDTHYDSIKNLNNNLKELAIKSDCNFIDNIPSFSYGDGEVDGSLFYDGLHLSQLGNDKLKAKLSTIGPVCIRINHRKAPTNSGSYRERRPISHNNEMAHKINGAKYTQSLYSRERGNYHGYLDPSYATRSSRANFSRLNMFSPKCEITTTNYEIFLDQPSR
ncbi:hypothetical protein HOLleu_26477 [Holothuria leucospilota]|uniref:Uncharacterized protein n=1 Tax=Holothuria leucospilota TaxID=206669 RepID=A0A9Q1H2I1_HOLLE|nr:hypothetical protein HOLleu_26477 [Holothuria leucospilota]